MQIVIDTRYCPCRTLKDECGISGEACYENDICSTCPLIRNGGVKLPKGHGRLIDADEFHHTLEDMSIRDNDKWFNWLQKACNRLAEAPTIVEADTGSEGEE